VLEKLFERIKRIEADLDPKRTGKVFNVLGDVFPANQLERMLRDMYARNLTEDVIKERIVREVDTERLQRITASALEGLATRELNLSAIVGKSEEAKERRLVPEVIEDFFVQAAPLAGMTPRADRQQSHVYRLGRVPRLLLPYGARLEPRFGKLGREYKQIVFDKALLTMDPTLEWVTPGHALFESVRAMVHDMVQSDLQRGCFYDLPPGPCPARSSRRTSVTVGGRLAQASSSSGTPVGTMTVRRPTVFLDFRWHHRGPGAGWPDLPGREQAKCSTSRPSPTVQAERSRRRTCRPSSHIWNQLTHHHRPCAAPVCRVAEPEGLAPRGGLEVACRCWTIGSMT
jgi:hypothetical protein